MITFKLHDNLKARLYDSYSEIKSTLDTYLEEDLPSYNKFLNFIVALHVAYSNAGFESKDKFPWIMDVDFIKEMVKVHGAAKVDSGLQYVEFGDKSVTAKEFSDFLTLKADMPSATFQDTVKEHIEAGVKPKYIPEEKPKVVPFPSEKVVPKTEDAIPEKATSLTEEEEAKLLKVKSNPNLTEYIEGIIKSKYNTTAVTALDILNYFTANEERMLTIDAQKYGSAMYGLAINIESPVVEVAVKEISSKWESNEFAISVIDDYLIKHGATMETLQREQKRLLNYLPEDLKNENSPDIYKLYRAVLIMEQKSDQNSNDMLNDADVRQTYIASMEDSMEDEVPFDVANHIASEDAVASKGLLGKLGTVSGSIVKLKYSLADDYNSAMKSALGDYTDDYEADREEAQAKKQRIKEERESRQADRYQRTSSLYGTQSVYSTGAYSNRHRGMNRNYNGYNAYSRNNQFNARSIPAFVIAIIAHILVVLILAIIAGWGGALIPAVGCIVASIGWVQQRQQRVDWWKMLIGGYAIVALGLLFL